MVGFVEVIGDESGEVDEDEREECIAIGVIFGLGGCE